MTKSLITKEQRVRLVRAFMRETERICKTTYGGDWDLMPKSHAGLPIDWVKCIRSARVMTTPAGAAKLVASASDEIMELADSINISN